MFTFMTWAVVAAAGVHGLFVPWTIRTIDDSYFRLFVLAEALGDVVYTQVHFGTNVHRTGVNFCQSGNMARIVQ